MWRQKERTLCEDTGPRPRAGRTLEGLAGSKHGAGLVPEEENRAWTPVPSPGPCLPGTRLREAWSQQPAQQAERAQKGARDLVHSFTPSFVHRPRGGAHQSDIYLP